MAESVTRRLRTESFFLPWGGEDEQLILQSAVDLREITPMENLDNQTILLAIVAVTALALLVQAIILLAMLLTLRKAVRSLKEEIDDLRSSVTPVLDRAWEFLNRIGPKADAAATDLAAVANRLREQTANVKPRPKTFLSVCASRAAGWMQCSQAFWMAWTGPAASSPTQ